MVTLSTSEKFKKILGVYLSLLFLVLISLLIYVYKTLIENILRSALGIAGMFLLSFTASLSVIPIPYLVIVLRIAPYVNPILMSIVVGLGAALGEIVSWCFGRIASKALEGSIYARRTNALLKYFQQKPMAIPILAFIFSLTFLPDKVLYLPLGIIRYSIWRIMPFTVLGKTIMVYLVLFFGRALHMYLADFGNDTTSFAVTSVLLAIAMLVLIFVDWEKILMKRLPQT